MEFGILHWSAKLAIAIGICFFFLLLLWVGERKGALIKSIGEKIFTFALEMFEDMLLIILAILS